MTPVDQRPSSFNHYYTRTSAMPYGRQMRGFDGIPDGPYHDSWAGKDVAVQQAAIADDNVGNGIFDGAGSPPTAHAGSGVFESHYALPGQLYREHPGRPSEVLDQTTGEPIIFNPSAGGSWHEDVLRTYRRFDQETPRYYSSPPYVKPQELKGFGAVEGKDSTTKYAIGGLIVGVAAAILFGMQKEGK
jgi:hypothetical protein